MFGENLKKCRADAGISQKELSIRLNVSQQTVGSWEVNRTSPSPEMITAIAKALDVSVGSLLGHVEMQKNNDILSDVVIRARTDSEFFEALKCIYELDRDKLSSLLSFLK